MTAWLLYCLNKADRGYAPARSMHGESCRAEIPRGVSSLGAGAMPGSIYDRSTRELFKEFLESFEPPPEKGLVEIRRKPLSEGGHFTRREILEWFEKHYGKIKRGTVNAHLIVMSTNAPSRVHHNLRPAGADDLLFQLDRSRFRLYLKDREIGRAHV